ncbi:MAG: hypothetical protein A7316_05640 [Candidatus Altiarchaeales archaeon WOR_SM1_86-2]|nr:MAG: hypothetical protein A7316_05640 [Candidatus Altiarchaeales archaeon WOR_SM1_86-2]ODS39546.1 MAG: hypothetical protein A7315_10890 [Candidatus Altiarchaeales archaeon WOR_SM1_79]
MAAEEVVTMSDEGEVIVPGSIRKALGLKGKNKFIAIGGDDYIMFKQIKTPSPKEEFESLSREIEKKFREEGIERKDVEEAIKWARRK